MRFWGLVKRVVVFTKKPITQIVLSLLKPIVARKVEEEIVEDQVNPIVSSDISLLILNPSLWMLGSEKTIFLNSQLRESQVDRGVIEVSGNENGPYTAITNGPWFTGDSPFPFTSQETQTQLKVTAHTEGTFWLRVKLSGGDEVIFSSGQRVRVMTVTEGSIG